MENKLLSMRAAPSPRRTDCGSATYSMGEEMMKTSIGIPVGGKKGETKRLGRLPECTSRYQRSFFAAYKRKRVSVMHEVNELF